VNNAYSYIAGPLPSDSPFYIQREADQEVIRLLERMEYVQLSESPQQGKTSLIFHVRNRLNNATRIVAYLDVTALKIRTEADWYRDLKEQLIQQLRSFLKVEELKCVPVDASSWRTFLQELMSTRTRHRSSTAPQIIIALDEVEHVPIEWATPFFQVLRQVHTMRSIESNFKRLSFMLSGSFNPQHLTADMPSSPFNIATRVDLKDFDMQQVSHLLGLFSFAPQEVRMHDALARRIYYWTDGQPYLTHWLCHQLAAEQTRPITTDLVDKAVRGLLHSNDSSLSNDNHLSRIGRVLSKEPVLYQYLEKIISEPVSFAPSLDINPRQFQLVHVYGLLKPEKGYCRIRNRVYELYLEQGLLWQEWVHSITEQLKMGGEITPRSSNIPEAFWRDAIEHYKRSLPEHLPVNETDSGRVVLLRGINEIKALQDALQTARNEMRTYRGLQPEGSLAQMIALLHDTVGLKGSGHWIAHGLLRATTVGTGASLRDVHDMPESTPMIFVPASEISPDIGSTLARLAGDLVPSQFFSFVVPLAATKEGERDSVSQLKWILSHSPYDFVILSVDTLTSIFVNQDSHIAFLRSVAKQVSPQKVSPFILQGPVTTETGMFYGREKEFGKILNGLQSRSFVIVGNRRIGKTSLLNRIKQDREQNPHYLVFHKNLQGHSVTPEQLRADFAALEQRANGRIIVQFIDEPDALLAQDAQQRYRCSAVWRELAETRRCRFVFAGHRILRRSLYDAASPFFNFAEIIHLGFLDYRHTSNLLTEPLSRLGFTLEPEQKIIGNVWNVSAGHPNIVQVIGKQLLERLERGSTVISQEDLKQVLDSAEFQKEYEAAMWGGESASEDYGVSPLERLILLLGDPSGFTREQIERMLHQYRVYVEPKQVHDALEVLTDFNLLNLENNRYSSNVRQFRDKLFKHYGREYLLKFYKEAIKEG
jgi:AAA-like domain